MEIHGRFWVKKDGKNYLGLGRVDLLKGIVNEGSMSKSAKNMSMSYKAAWDNIDTINNLADKPLVERFIGGKGGSGSVLTKEGHKAIEAYDELMKAKESFCNYFKDTKDLDELKKRAKEVQKLLKVQ